jgi:hypothetical protein
VRALCPLAALGHETQRAAAVEAHQVRQRRPRLRLKLTRHSEVIAS